jgi:DNA-binding response OmpR family regulator
MSKILIIEDDEALRKAYEIILNKEGFEVTLAGSGQEGLEAASTNEPDLILVDMLMPVSNGLEFLRRYDPAKKHPGVKVIVFSNINEQSVVHEAISLGASHYLTKDSKSPKELVEFIKANLANSNSQ